MTGRFACRKLLWYGPAGVLLVAYIAVCFQAHTPWPWMHIVHEDGHRTLLGTLLYFEHATRELPADLILGLAVAGSACFFFPTGTMEEKRADQLRLANRFFLVTAILIVMILAGTLLTVPLQKLLENLAQMQTRPGEQLRVGAHWRFHFLERVTLMFVAYSAIGLKWLLLGRPASAPCRARGFLLVIAATLFALLSFVYGFSAEPFTDTVFLGHQARELLTHSLVTLPLSLGTVLALARRFGDSSGTSRPSVWPIYASASVAVALGLYLAVGSVVTGAHLERQTQSVYSAIFPHFFEHAFTYLVVPLTAGLAYLASASWGRSKWP